MKTSKKDLLKTAKLLEAIDLSEHPDWLDSIRPHVVVARSVGKYGFTAKLIFSLSNKKFYFASERNGILFELD